MALDADYMNLAKKQPEGLKVVKGSLQLRVRRKCGTGHAFAVLFDVPDEAKVEDQISEDLKILTRMLQENVQNGELVINGRTYIATEVTELCDKQVTCVLGKLPVVVLPPKLTTVIKPVVLPPVPKPVEKKVEPVVEKTVEKKPEPALDPSLKEANAALDKELEEAAKEAEDSAQKVKTRKTK